MRDLPKGVYEYKLTDGSTQYEFKTWAGGSMDIQKKGFATPREAEYARHVAVYGHHWENMPQDLDGFFGFVYEMEEISTGRKYIGSKQLLFWDGPRGGYKCTDPGDEWFDDTLWKESDWAFYTSSSKPIAKRIEDSPWKFRYKVLTMCTNKLDLHLCEIGEQISRNVLEATDEHGNYLYLNENILGVEYRPPVPKDKLKVSIEETKRAVRDYYLRPVACERCGSLLPFGQTRCPNAPLFGDGDCNETYGTSPNTA